MRLPSSQPGLFASAWCGQMDMMLLEVGRKKAQDLTCLQDKVPNLSKIQATLSIPKLQTFPSPTRTGLLWWGHLPIHLRELTQVLRWSCPKGNLSRAYTRCISKWNVLIFLLSAICWSQKMAGRAETYPGIFWFQYWTSRSAQIASKENMALS